LRSTLKENKRTRVAFVVQQPKGISPAQRFRIELWEPVLDEHGIEHETFPFFDVGTRAILYQKGFFLRKVLGVCSGVARRVALMLKLRSFDYVFLQREFAPVGPPIFEWIAAKVLGTCLILDFDDAIWIPNTSSENRLSNAFKAFWKVAYVCSWSRHVVVGNEFLASFAREYSRQVIVLPTCVDTVHTHCLQRRHHSGAPVIVGWTGSFSTLFYLDALVPALRELQQDLDFVFRVIADREPKLDLENFEFVRWSADTEVEDLAQFDIGVMPLIDDLWANGKCGFKLIQYLSLGIPAVASPVGVNPEILEHGMSGYLCQTTSEWVQALRVLILDSQLRAKMGRRGRMKVVREYSVEAHAQEFLTLFGVLENLWPK
jgi:glycosyltransferase involved in cell wall biosynthesis